LNFDDFCQETIFVSQLLQLVDDLVVAELRLCGDLAHFDKFRKAINFIDGDSFSHILNCRFFNATRIFGALEDFPLLFDEIGGKHL
jgi:hypothetical protein